MKQKTIVNKIREHLSRRREELKRLDEQGLLLPNEYVHKSNELSSLSMSLARFIETERKHIEDAFLCGESNNEFHDKLFTDKAAYFNETFDQPQ